MAKTTYSDAGVDLDAYAETMSRLPRLLHRTFSPRVIPQDGGFAGLFQLDFANRLFARQYKNPVLVSCCDGVGTKLKVAQLTGRHDTVGIDLVAMSINDAICCGAEPLFFLDYVAVSKDDPDLLEQIVNGISDGCMQADCALLGGETAVMPDLYQPGDYDLAGFCVGVTERDELVDGSAIVEEDLLIGLASSGLHSNGYSLARKIVFEIAKLDVSTHIADLDDNVGDALLKPTCIYARCVRRVLAHYKIKNVVHGISHITGGGLQENLSRILPASVNAVIHNDAWSVPNIFGWLQQLGDVEDAEMHRVFNMGIGLVLVVSPYYAPTIMRMLADEGIESWTIGHIALGEGRSVWARG